MHIAHVLVMLLSQAEAPAPAWSCVAEAKLPEASARFESARSMASHEDAAVAKPVAGRAGAEAPQQGGTGETAVASREAAEDEAHDAYLTALFPSTPERYRFGWVSFPRPGSWTRMGEAADSVSFYPEGWPESARPAVVVVLEDRGRTGTLRDLVAAIKKANQHARFQEGPAQKTTIDSRPAKYRLLTVSDEGETAARKLVVLLADFEVHAMPPALGRMPSTSRKRQLRIIVSLPTDCQAGDSELEEAFLGWIAGIELI